MATRIGVVGAAGRMGRRLLEMILLEPGAELAAAIEAPGHPALGQYAHALCQSEIPQQAQGRDVQVTAELPENVPDVMIEFAAPQQTVDTARLAAERGFAFVSGTTGLSAEQKMAVRMAGDTVPVIHAPNCSTGMNVLFIMAAEMARLLGDGYDVEIVESHHRFKKDAPSGTALRIAETIAEALERRLDDVAVYGRQGFTGERPEEQIAIHALRRGDVVGEHTVSFTTMGETLELTHRAHSRDAFARGAVRAAMWICGKEPGLYTMDQVLGL